MYTREICVVCMGGEGLARGSDGSCVMVRKRYVIKLIMVCKRYMMYVLGGEKILGSRTILCSGVDGRLREIRITDDDLMLKVHIYIYITQNNVYGQI